MAAGEDDAMEDDGVEGSTSPIPPERSPSSAGDVATSQAKREAAAARIRAIRDAGQQRIDQMFADHLADHGEETETSAEYFLRETERVDEVEAAED